MSNTPVPTNGESKETRIRAKEYQLEAIARLAVLGTAAGTIAATVGLPETYINRLLSGKANETFNKLFEDYQRQVMKNVVGAHFELSLKLPEALVAIGEALNAQDIRVRSENAWRVWDKLVPDFNKPHNGNGKSDSWQITINQPEVRALLGDTMASVASSLARLREPVVSQDADQYMKVGTDALPIPPSQLEVTEGEAQIQESEIVTSEMVLEAVERDE